MAKLIEIDMQGSQEVELPEFSLAAILAHRGEDAEKYAEEYIDDTSPEMRVDTYGDIVVVQIFNYDEDADEVNTNSYIGKLADFCLTGSKITVKV